MAVGTSYLVTLIIIICSLASLAFPRTFALPNRTDLGTTAGKKESCCCSWFFQKAPYLCTPPRINRIHGLTNPLGSHHKKLSPRLENQNKVLPLHPEQH